MKMNSFNKIKDDITLQKIEILEGMEKEKRRMNKDEWLFLVFVYFLVLFITLLIAYPTTHFMNLVSTILPIQILVRHIYYAFYDPNKKIFFCTDLCYFATYSMIYFINYDKTNEELFRTIFILGNGVLAVSLFAFGNVMLLHDHDSMASFAIHCFPMVICLSIRWYIIPSEAHLPEEERTWLTFTDEELFGEYFW